MKSSLIKDASIGALGGIAGTFIMGKLSTFLYKFEDEQKKKQEERLRSAPPYFGDDADSYFNIMKPLADNWEDLMGELLQPAIHFPKHPLLMASFGLRGLSDAESFIKRKFRNPRTQALLAGIAAHANAPLDRKGTSAITLMLNIAAHGKGWPIVQGGSQQLANALVHCLRSLGGEVETHKEILSLKDLPRSRMIFFDLTPKGILSLLGDSLKSADYDRMANFEYGPGVFKMDWALSGPIPWSAKDCALAATVHIGDTFEEIAQSETLPSQGKFSSRPYVLLSQPSLFDPSRAPEGKHTAWAYCHVPNGATENMTEVIEQQIERFAPGFSNIILKRSVLSPLQLK